MIFKIKLFKTLIKERLIKIAEFERGNAIVLTFPLCVNVLNEC